MHAPFRMCLVTFRHQPYKVGLFWGLTEVGVHVSSRAMVLSVASNVQGKIRVRVRVKKAEP